MHLGSMHAPVAHRIERLPAEQEAASSILARRTSATNHQQNRSWLRHMLLGLRSAGFRLVAPANRVTPESRTGARRLCSEVSRGPCHRPFFRAGGGSADGASAASALGTCIDSLGIPAGDVARAPTLAFISSAGRSLYSVRARGNSLSALIASLKASTFATETVYPIASSDDPHRDRPDTLALRRPVRCR